MSLTLLDWRRSVAAMYGDVRRDASRDPEGALGRFRASRDRLFAGHPDSPLPADRGGFAGLPYWPYRTDLRFEVPLEPARPERLVAVSGTGEPFPLDRIGRIALPLGTLDVYWIAVYGAGRYLLDTVKGADLGGSEGRLVVDFNYAYHPSCAYDPRWSCPLAPPANHLEVRVEAGERL